MSEGASLMRGRREMATALMACVLLFAGATAVVGTLIEDSRRDGRASIGDAAGGAHDELEGPLHESSKTRRLGYPARRRRRLGGQFRNAAGRRFFRLVLGHASGRLYIG